ncbi:MAG: hypothetical protein GXP24_10070 [Planctomycetes bacterium]|nr:hypothetical protein [Planctomycetota bacterium]
MVADLNDETIASFFRKRLVDGKAIRTAECEMIDLRTFWYFAHKQGYLPDKPGPRPAKIPDPRTKHVNLEVSQDEDIRQCDFL